MIHPKGRASDLAERRSLLRRARGSLRDKRLCLERLRRNDRLIADAPFVLKLARHLVPANDDDIRWGTLVLVGDMAKAPPRELWSLVVRWGSARDEDLRMGTACCVLEHLLENRFATTFAKIRRIVRSGNRRFADTALKCSGWVRFTLGRHAEQFEAFLTERDRVRRA